VSENWAKWQALTKFLAVSDPVSAHCCLDKGQQCTSRRNVENWARPERRQLRQHFWGGNCEVKSLHNVRGMEPHQVGDGLAQSVAGEVIAGHRGDL
jgi:hypothetical protein